MKIKKPKKPKNLTFRFFRFLKKTKKPRFFKMGLDSPDKKIGNANAMEEQSGTRQYKNVFCMLSQCRIIMQQENKRVFSCFLNDLASFCMCVCRTVDVCVCMYVRMYVDPM